MNRELLGLQIALTGLLAKPSGSDPESKKTETAEEVCPQELRKIIRVPMIRWEGGVCWRKHTGRKGIVELHRGGEIGRPFGPPLARSVDYGQS